MNRSVLISSLLALIPCILMPWTVTSTEPAPPPPLEASEAAAAPAEAPPAAAQGLTLEQALLMALQQNADLQVQAFEPLIAGTFPAREQARFAPEAFATASHLDSSSSETARSTGEQFDAEVQQNRLTGGIRRQFATGTEVELSAQHAGETSNRAPDQEEARLAIALTQPLLQGAGRTVNLASVQRARLDFEISEAELRGYTEAILAEAESAYWRYWLAVETIAITEQALEVAEKQLDDMRQRIAVGQLARNEEAVAQAEVARRRQVLIDAQANRVRRTIELQGLIAPSQELPSRVLQTPPELPEADPADTLEKRIDVADQARADLQEARLRLEQRRLDTVVSRDGLLPRLDFFAQLAKTGFGPDMGNAWSEIGGDGYAVEVGLRLSRSLGDRAETARDDEMRFRQEQAVVAVENLRLKIGRTIRLAANEFERALKQIDASAETRRLQTLTVESEIERFRVGTGTALQVAQAQRDLLSSRIDEQQARVAARLALLQLYLAEGSLLQRRGIVTP